MHYVQGEALLVFARRRQLLQNHGLKPHSLQPSGAKLMREQTSLPAPSVVYQ
jgi:hypothetical protein